jgi:polyisoprenoid-binding protein YceI
MKKVGDNKFKVTGDFTMLGVTKEVTFDVKYGGTIKDPWGNTKAGFKVTGTIDRTDWGLKYNSTMDTGGVMIGEDVDIVCNFELIKIQ